MRVINNLTIIKYDKSLRFQVWEYGNFRFEVLLGFTGLKQFEVFWGDKYIDVIRAANGSQFWSPDSDEKDVIQQWIDNNVDNGPRFTFAELKSIYKCLVDYDHWQFEAIIAKIVPFIEDEN